MNLNLLPLKMYGWVMRHTLIKRMLTALPLVMFMAIIPSATLADTITTKVALYNSVWWSTFWTWLIVSLLGSLVAAVISAMVSRGCILPVLLAGALFLGGIGAYINSGLKANAAASTDWDDMVIEKATYVEKLLGVFVRADRIHTPQDEAGNPLTCWYNDTDTDIGALAATGCRYATRDSYCASWDFEDDECDDTDYKWYPWFTHEESLSADLNIYEDGHLVFANRCAPPNWPNHNQYLPSKAVAGVDFCIAESIEWDRVDQALRDKRLLPGVAYSNTLNWVNADKETVFRGSTSLVPQYQSRGLIPSILPITDSNDQTYAKDIFGNVTGPLGYDFEIVQFLGSLDPPQKLQDELQRVGLLWASGAGPKLKANLMLNLAYASEIDSPDQWNSVIKAHLMDNEVWASTPFKTTLAMNMAIWNCGVSDDMTSILWCRMETGAFEDNVELKLFVSRLQPVPLTAEALFGNMTGGFILNGNDYVMSNPDWDDRDVELATVDFVFTGGVINQAMYGVSSGHEFVKVSKDRYSDKQYVIQPDPEQIQRIKNNRGSQTLWTILGIWGTILLMGFGAVSKMNE